MKSGSLGPCRKVRASAIGQQIQTRSVGTIPFPTQRLHAKISDAFELCSRKNDHGKTRRTHETHLTLFDAFYFLKSTFQNAENEIMVQVMFYALVTILLVPIAIGNMASTHKSDENRPELDHKRHQLRVKNIPCPMSPPFLAPFTLSNSESFEILSSCPFQLHEQITKQEVRGCFPMYSVPEWNSSSYVSFQIHEFNEKRESSLVLETKSVFANSEDLNIKSNSNMEKLGQCIDDLNFRVEGVSGEFSGENDVVSLALIAMSFKENEKERTILIPVGGCECYLEKLRVNGKEKETSLTKMRESISGNFCSIQQDNIEWNDCTRNCYFSMKSNYIDAVDKLITNYRIKLSKSKENMEAVLRKLMITRTTQLSNAFARCKCKHNDQDLRQCFLLRFLDTLIAENEYHFEVEKIFDQHREEVEIWLQNNHGRICDASSRAVLMCQNEC